MKATEKQIEKALINAAGFQTVAAEQLGITNGALSQRIKKSKNLQDLLHDIQEKRLDLAESKLLSNLKAGDQRAIEFYLRHKGESRGYYDKQRFTLENDADNPMEIKVVWEK